MPGPHRPIKFETLRALSNQNRHLMPNYPIRIETRDARSAKTKMAAVTCTPLSLKKVVKTTTKHGYSIRILVEKRKKLVNMFSNDG